MRDAINRMMHGVARFAMLAFGLGWAAWATAATPTVSWYGDFPSATTTKNGVKLYPTNGASSQNGEITVSTASGQTGPAFELPASGYVSVVFKADLTGVTLAADQVLFAFGNSGKNYWVGSKLKSNGNGGLYATGMWGGTTDGAEWNTADDTSNLITLTGEQTFLITYDKGDSATKGTHLYVLQNGSAKPVYGKSSGNGLKSGDVTKLGIGGGYGSLTGLSRMGGLKITACDIYLSSTALPVKPADLPVYADFPSRRDFSGTTAAGVNLVMTTEEYGKGSINVSGATGVSSFTVYAPDGTTSVGTITPDGNGDGSLEKAVAVSGLACWCDYEMNGSLDNTGLDSIAMSYDGSTSANSFYNSQLLYTYTHPYRAVSYPSTWTAVVRCTVPKVPNGVVVTFGTCNGGLIGLVAGDNPETQMKLIKTTGNSQYSVLSTMTIVDGTSAQHVYVFSVENNSTIKVYCDGDEVLNETYAEFTLGGGIQVGSVHGGVNDTGVTRVWKGDAYNGLTTSDLEEARIDCVRLYDYSLSADQITALSTEFPAVKLYRATVADGANTDWNSLTWSPSWDGGNAYSKIILTAAGDASLTLPSSITAEDFTISVPSGSTLSLGQPSGGVTMTVAHPIELDGGAIAFASSLNLGNSLAVNGTGTISLGNGVVVDEAISGTAKVEIPSGATVGVVGGSIANPITGAGVIGFTALPASALSFSSWTGTVELPAITSGTEGGLNLNNYGVSGSIVQIAGISGDAWLANAAVVPTVDLAGDVTLNAFSPTFANTFAKMTGSGTFTISATGMTTAQGNKYFLIKDVSEFTGSLSTSEAGIVLGGNSKPDTTDRYGKIVVQAPVTVGAGATWTASGVVLANTTATLTVPSGATVPTVKSGVPKHWVKRMTDGSGNTVYSLSTGFFLMVE